ncbi:uncharacterized protein LOC116831172 [Chelonoidis abingdonii]|uniref:uncharacterized protein LOC116831172 n=1 Tax=Chelonoidis abingdonii TaxID=106734 RepID=UPI0013F1B17F|nr:uncharacterized protein LOC116831172 [Chelonoidis abingdonii]
MEILHLALCCLWLLQRTAVAAGSIRVQCGETAILPCPTAAGRMHNYWAIGWYKVANKSHEMGLIRRHENSTHVYSGTQREFLMDVQQSLVIPEVQPEDSGAYRCSLWARVGHFNQQADIVLQVSECSTLQSATLPRETLLLGSEQGSSVNPNSTCCCGKPVPVLAMVLGLLALNVGKGLLSLAFALVIVIILKGKRRKKVGESL